MSTLTDYDQDRIKVKVESNADCHKNNWTYCNRMYYVYGSDLYLSKNPFG